MLPGTRSLTDPEPNETQSPQLALWEKCRVSLHQEKARGQKMTNMGNFDYVEYIVLTPLSLGFSPLFSALTLSPPFHLLLPFFGQDFSNDDTRLEYNVDADNGIAMEGYLFKRASNAFKTWNRSDTHISISTFMNTLKIPFHDKP